MGIFNDNTKNIQNSQKGADGKGFKLTQDGNFDIENKQLKNVKNGTDNKDAINKNQIESYVQSQISIPPQ